MVSVAQQVYDQCIALLRDRAKRAHAGTVKKEVIQCVGFATIGPSENILHSDLRVAIVSARSNVVGYASEQD